jgi:Flp pilus assembly protein TadG
MTSWTRIARDRLSRLISDRKGGVAVLMAMSLTTMLGFTGLATEAAVWYVDKRNMQGAADAAAFSAATAEAAGANSTSFTAAAKAVTAQYGFTAGTGGVAITVNNPPHSGNYTSNTSAIEVLVSQPQSMLFSSLFLSSAPSISTRAVAAPGSSAGGNGCVMALDHGNVIGVDDSGSATLDLSNCSLYVNSSDTTALDMSGSASISAYAAYIVGNYAKSGSATITTTHGVSTGVSATADPYASVNIPSYSGCNSTNLSVSRGTTNLAPTIAGGIYVACNGISVSGSSTLNLAPGTYIMNEGTFNVSGSATVNGTGGVTIILTGSGSNYATAQISGGTTLNITAPTTGATAGLAFFQDRNAPSSGTDNFSGGSTQKITGAIYFPDQEVTYSGGSGSTGASQCTQLIAYTLNFSGSSTFNNNCSGTGVQTIGGSASATRLLE